MMMPDTRNQFARISMMPPFLLSKRGVNQSYCFVSALSHQLGIQIQVVYVRIHVQSYVLSSMKRMLTGAPFRMSSRLAADP